MKKLNQDSALYKAGLLGILCAVCGLLLSVANAITAPVIAENALATIKASLEEIYPGATFNDVTEKYIAQDETGLIDGIYEAEGKGYIFTLHGVGYNSNGFTFMVGFDNDGAISGYTALEQQETSGIGARAFEQEYSDQIKSLTSSDPIPLLSGATLTSTAVQKGIDAAKAIFNDLQGISYDPNAQAATPEPAKAQPLANEDYSATGVTVEEVSNDGKTAVYHCTAKGFEGTNEADVTVDLESGTIVSIAVTAFNDTPGVGDTATTDAELARYSGKGLNDMIDSTTGASMTSRSLRAMAANALSLATGTELTPGAGDATASGSGIGSEDFSDREAGCIVYTNLDETAFVYDCKATGYQGVNKAYVTVDTTTGTVKSIEVTEFNDTPGVGDTATTAEELARYEGATLESSVDATAGASMTSASIRAMAAAALNMAAGK
jgi:Na+-translocating ferredoxin:NAD+ oxidoreductase RnfG subunit